MWDHIFLREISVQKWKLLNFKGQGFVKSITSARMPYSFFKTAFTDVFCLELCILCYSFLRSPRKRHIFHTSLALLYVLISRVLKSWQNARVGCVKYEKIKLLQENPFFPIHIVLRRKYFFLTKKKSCSVEGPTKPEGKLSRYCPFIHKKVIRE